MMYENTNIMKKNVSSKYKVSIAIKTFKDTKNPNQIGGTHEIYPMQAGLWKK